MSSASIIRFASTVVIWCARRSYSVTISDSTNSESGWLLSLQPPFGTTPNIGISLDWPLSDAEQVLAQHDRLALIVLDIATPSASNQQMMQRLKTAPATFDIPIVICSALTDGIRIWEEGADYYLGKPVMYDDFVATLTKAGVALAQ